MIEFGKWILTTFLVLLAIVVAFVAVLFFFLYAGKVFFEEWYDARKGNGY